MRSTARRFIGKVLPDGHLSLPEDTAKSETCNASEQ